MPVVPISSGPVPEFCRVTVWPAEDEAITVELNVSEEALTVAVGSV
jgi:hypothetical protein